MLVVSEKALRKIAEIINEDLCENYLLPDCEGEADRIAVAQREKKKLLELTTRADLVRNIIINVI